MATEESLKQKSILRFRHSIQALALDPKIQLTLFPDFVCKADELALTFDQWYSWAIGDSRTGIEGNIVDELTEAQNTALHLLDTRLREISGEGNGELWTENALQERAEWQEIRLLAQKVLLEFEWPLEVPPSYVKEYIGSK